jgi:argininosuccinate lyase
MAKLWQEKDSENELSEAVNCFTVGDDYMLDQRLVPYDIRASKAHADGLLKAGILSETEVQQLHGALDKALAQWEAGNFSISREQEDCHTAIEQFLVEDLGETGKKIHAGRSRNDQVLVAMRLFEKEQLEQLSGKVLDLAEVLLNRAERWSDVPMPGYTHTQKAMPSSVGMWLASMAEMLLMDLESLKGAYTLVNKCPLGTAAGFGVNIDLPREKVSDALGFAEPVTVSLTAQNTRGKIDLKLLQALETIGSTLAHFANDLVLYTSQEFGYFELHEAIYTGSSIMPQKRNPDPAELVRARSGNLSGAVQAAKMITHKMYSGYHRDYQPVKKHVMAGLDELNDMLDMSRLLAEHLQPVREKLIAACTPEMFAADRANELVKQGMPFREAYHRLKEGAEHQKGIDPVENIKSKTHLGSTGNLGLERLREKAEDWSL